MNGEDGIKTTETYQMAEFAVSLSMTVNIVTLTLCGWFPTNFVAVSVLFIYKC